LIYCFLSSDENGSFCFQVFEAMLYLLKKVGMSIDKRNQELCFCILIILLKLTALAQMTKPKKSDFWTFQAS